MSFIYCHLNFHANLLRPWPLPLIINAECFRLKQQIPISSSSLIWRDRGLNPRSSALEVSMLTITLHLWYSLISWPLSEFNCCLMRSDQFPCVCLSGINQASSSSYQTETCSCQDSVEKNSHLSLMVRLLFFLASFRSRCIFSIKFGDKKNLSPLKN
jgi:hypothetical protein